MLRESPEPDWVQARELNSPHPPVGDEEDQITEHTDECSSDSSGSEEGDAGDAGAARDAGAVKRRRC
eukprot:gene4357-biopygen7750